MTKDFAYMQQGGGGIVVLSANDLSFSKPQKFVPSSNFYSGCKNENMKKNLVDGYGYDNNVQSGTLFDKILDTAKNAATIWSTQKTQSSDIEKARIAADIARSNAAAAAAAAASDGGASKIKAYTIPILITGVVVIGGIIAYFTLKKKK